MKILLSKSYDVQKNLSLEELLLKDEEINEDILMFYINNQCIVVGKNQNVWEEINDDFVKANNINLARRISGGGAVYQDLNNICFSFITNKTKSYTEFLKPVLKFFKSLGLDAKFHGKNDVHINGFKVSGNAQYKFKDRMFHHGTILYNTSIENLAKALKPNQLKIASKGIKSVRQRVANIYDLLDNKITTNEFVNKLVNFFKNEYGAQDLDVSNYKLEALKKLTEKRKSKDWIYGKNPKFAVENQKRFQGGTIKLLIDTKLNKISNINFTGDFLSSINIENVYKEFIDKEYNKREIKKIINDISNFNDYFGKITKDELFSLFF